MKSYQSIITKNWLKSKIMRIVLLSGRVVLLGVLCLLQSGCATLDEGFRTCRVPDVRNMSVTEAQGILEQNGFRLGDVYGNGPVVLLQDPDPWDTDYCGSVFSRKIDVWLENNEESYFKVKGTECRVPDVRKMSLSEARRVLEQNKFKLGDVHGDGPVVLAHDPDPWDEESCYTEIDVYLEYDESKRWTLEWIKPMTCRGGGRLTIANDGNNGVCITFEAGKGAAYEGPEPGQCTWSDRGLRDGEPRVICDGDNKRASQYVGKLVRSDGTVIFQVYNYEGRCMRVTKIGP